MKLNNSAFINVSILAITFWLVPVYANAWVYHEHWFLTARTIKLQSAEYQKEIEKVWDEVTKGQGTQFCDSVDGTLKSYEEGKPCVDFATWPATAGDHSCGTGDLWDISRNEKWILKIIDVAGKTSDQLNSARTIEDKKNAVDIMHLRMENDDIHYSTRAEVNGSHFLMPRESGENLEHYFNRVTAPGAPINAMGVYSLFHHTALFNAHQAFLAADIDKKRTFLRNTMLAEAFAHHFLQDMFSSGHIIGSWDNVAWRKGTHDYYCETGIDAHLWDGEDYAAFGDGFMKLIDVEMATRALSVSMHQVIDVASGSGEWFKELSPFDFSGSENVTNEYSCKTTNTGYSFSSEVYYAVFEPVLSKTIKPGLGEKSAFMPRFRAEIGPFFKLYSAARAGMAFKGYGSELSFNGNSYDSTPRFRTGLSFGAGIGFGLEGVTGRRGDGAIYIQAGMVIDKSQFDGHCGDCSGDLLQTGHRGKYSSIPRVPGRSAIEMRFRLPFWLFPGDLIIAAPFMAIISPHLLKAMAIRATRGGLIPWQMVMNSGIGTFQFVIGREMGISWYGYVSQPPVFVYQTPFDSGYDEDFHPASLKTIELDFPVLDYRPFRTFSTRIASSVIFQLGFSVDIAKDVTLKNISANQDLRLDRGTKLSLEPSYTVYIRIAFDGRLYL